MSLDKFVIRKVAVLGAGVMGAQIAAHLANAKIETILFDLPSTEGPKNSIAEKALQHLTKMSPAPLATKTALNYMRVANYDDDLSILGSCDLVIEAVAERLEIKEELYKKVGESLGENTIFATNTSGLSIETLAAHLPAQLKSRFCGVHFFNPPRYMHLVELTPTQSTDLTVVDQLEGFLVSVLGKGVIRTKDTPNFIANRIGVFSMLSTIHNAKKFGLRFDVVDDLTGTRIGRPKSATFRTTDVVGLDTFASVVKTMEDKLPNDPWSALFTLPPWVVKLIELGNLGAKTKAGIFKKEKNKIWLFDIESEKYIPADEKADREVTEILKTKDPTEKFRLLKESDHPQAQFMWSIFRDLFHYVIYHANDIAANAREIDFAIRWGYGWNLGPFEIINSIGIKTVVTWLKEDISSDKTLSNAPLPEWITSIDTFHNDEGSYSFSDNQYTPRPNLPVYKKQLLPPALLGESNKPLGDTIFENEIARAFTLDHEILIFQNKNKHGAISKDVLDALNQAIDLAEKEYDALVIWTKDAPFSVGADLKSMMPEFMSGNWKKIEAMIKLFQDSSMRIRYSQIPVVSAAQGYAFGGGCEFLLHSDRVVAALESYIGLVEVGVGLIPSGGGTKEFALRAAQSNHGDLLSALKDYYMNIATAKVATSALEAKELGYLKKDDVVVFNAYELLYIAINEAKAMADSGYRPAVEQTFPVGGRSLAATIQGELLNMYVGGFISEYDMHIGERIAMVMSGGNVDSGSIVDEQWVLDLERQTFIELLKNNKTLERITSMLTTGKPLRN